MSRPTDWEQSAETLWGADWQTPLADVVGVSFKTIQRWRIGEGAPSPEVVGELARLAAMDHPLVVGRMVRRLGAGARYAEIADEIAAERATLTALKAARGYKTIAALGRA